MEGVLLIGLGVAGGVLLWNSARHRRRRRLRLQPFPRDWLAILENNVKLYRFLPEELQQELQGHIQVFLAEKSFEGCEGLVVTDEMRVTIAGLACVLLLNRSTNYYPALQSILIYPRAYQVDDQVRLGESWSSGSVVLSWSDVARTARNFKDGNNLVFHEFAHQLDQQDGQGDGVPILEEQGQYAHWVRIMGREYNTLVARTRKHQKNLLQEYGATNPAEFFAVAVEAFFEKPVLLKRKHGELYQLLQDYFQLDPCQWIALNHST